VDENDYRLPDLFVGTKKAVVDAELASAVADDNGSIGRESHAIPRTKTEPLETDAQLLGVSRRRFVQLQRKLVAITQPPHTPTA
jgi:hypothetical protein